MNVVFIDSSAFFALLCPDDRHHKFASKLFEQAKRERWRLITTNAVVYETYALLLSRSPTSRMTALAFLDSLDAGSVEVMRVGVEDEREANVILRAHTDKRYSYCDSLSFAVMRRLEVRTAIAYDRHFQSFGQVIVL